MSPDEVITSPQNEKLKLIRRLAERRAREQEGLFVSEGEDLLAAGLRAGCRPELVLVPAHADRAAALAGEQLDLVPIAVLPEVLDQVSALGSGTRVIAVWPIPASEPAAGSGGCAYLEGVVDPGNVGTIVRTATALGGARVVLGPGCADPWGPKAVRASMGALFANPPSRGGLGSTPGPRLALDAHGGADLEAEIARIRPATLCLGAERDGLSPATLEACEGRATIAVAEGAESLNVAAAAAIALHRISSAGAATRSSWEGTQTDA